MERTEAQKKFLGGLGNLLIQAQIRMQESKTTSEPVFEADSNVVKATTQKATDPKK